MWGKNISLPHSLELPCLKLNGIQGLELPWESGMNADLLLLDVGNTAIKVGVAQGSDVIASYTLPSREAETSDSLGLTLLDLMNHAGVSGDQIRACAVSSVVPRIDALLSTAIPRYFGVRALFAGADLIIPLANLYSRPHETGADILVGAFEARSLFPEARSLIIVDFGTAVTFACVCDDSFLGGLIFPGVAIALDALSTRAAKLPQIDLTFPEDMSLTPGNNTTDSIRQGMLFGYAAMTDGLCSRLGQNLPKPCQIVGTGGFSAIISPLTISLKTVIPSLLLNGLARLVAQHLSGEV